MILIVGCGFLGSYLAKYASSQTDESIMVTVRNTDNIPASGKVKYLKCDVTKKADLADLAKECDNKPLTVFYFAACHNVDYVFENPDKARRVNIEALQSFFNTIPNIKKFFFASTDCVYGESKELKEKFNEHSPPAPINEYGRQKADAEKIVFSKGFTVLRLPFMLGASLTSKPHFYDNIRSKLLRGEIVEMIDGMERSVLSYRQTAQLIYSLSILPEAIPQIINICADKELSKYDIGCLMAKNLGTSPDLIKRISEEEGRKLFKDARASRTAMDNSLLKSLLGLKEIILDEETA